MGLSILEDLYHKKGWNNPALIYSYDPNNGIVGFKKCWLDKCKSNQQKQSSHFSY